MPSELPRRVLDVTLRAGAGAHAELLAFHRQRGDELRTVDASAHVRGAIGSSFEIVALLRRELAAYRPELVYAPDLAHEDAHARALAHALAAAAAAAPCPSALALLYGGEGDVAFEGTEARFRRADSAQLLALARARRSKDLPRATAVVSTWNKKEDVRANLDGLRSQTLPFAEIVVVDNSSGDGTAEMIARDYPDVRLIVMPHSRYGACETFNIGFASAQTELTAILDDDIVMPPEWLERATRRIAREPPTTAVLSTQVIEPDMPASYRDSPHVNTERYMSTFRGCASLARSKALREAEYYDERLFIYGNERDLTCRLLNLGYRVLQYPEASVFHKTPFGIKMGKRSLYYHARNAWLSMLKYAPLSDLLRMPWLVFSKVVLRGSKKEAEGTVTDAVGTIGIGKSLRETPGAWWVVMRAAWNVLLNVPYCLKHRRPVRAQDFELPLH
ncbi:MAG: glycosyltransferase family 2 protein [Planctomycetota bacterium]